MSQAVVTAVTASLPICAHSRVTIILSACESDSFVGRQCWVMVRERWRAVVAVGGGRQWVAVGGDRCVARSAWGAAGS